MPVKPSIHAVTFSRRHFIQLSALGCAFGGPVSSVFAAEKTIISKSKGEQTMTTTDTERFQRGLKKLKEIDGQAGENVIRSLQQVAPDLARYTIEYPFGDVYSRPGLDLKSREIATVAALTAMGNAAPQLKVHIHAALNVGCTVTEVMEIIIQMSVYAGFPAALNGAFAAEEVLLERGLIEKPSSET